MEGVQASSALDLSSVVCYYKTLNYPTLDFSTASPNQRSSDQTASKNEQGVEELGCGPFLTKVTTDLRKLLPENGTSVTKNNVSSKLKTSTQPPRTTSVVKSVSQSSTSNSTSVPHRKTHSIVIKNGELVTSGINAVRLSFVPSTQDQQQSRGKLTNGHVSVVQELHQGTEKPVAVVQPSLPTTHTKDTPQNGISLIQSEVKGELNGSNETSSEDGKTELCCGFCGAVFDLKETFDQHVATHVQNGGHSKITDKATSSKRSLNPVRHYCHLCTASFARKYRLTIHIRTHTGEKPYKCSSCDKTFKDSDHLRRHARTHSGLKPFKCDLCARTFADREHLKRHLNVHYSGGRVRAV